MDDMKYQGMERRRWPRAKVKIPVSYRGIGNFNHLPLESETQDLSEGGVKFSTERFLPRNSKFVIGFNLAPEREGIKATIKVIWTNREPTTNRYIVGAEFDNITLEARHELANLVRKNL
jgi:c-di-GMP-binding flagellar brake protein YcgR